MRHLANLWRDERGFSTVLSTIMLVTILALGAIVGLVTVRDQLVQEFGDVATALEQLDQSFNAEGYGSYADPAPAFGDTAGEAPEVVSSP